MLMWTGGIGDSDANRNILLRGLPPSDRRLIEPHLEPVEFDQGATAVSCGGAIESVLFPASGVFAIEQTVADRTHIEVALVGSEGLVGWPILLGVRSSAQAAIVRMHGAGGHRIAGTALLAACGASPTLYRSLLLFVHTIAFQMARTIACDLESTLDQRIARWLLMRHDRVGGDQLPVRHDEIADGLNARRASVTNRLHLLEGEHVIRSRRGRIVILDRAGLETAAGECYGAAEAEYRRLIGPFGKVAIDRGAPGLARGATRQIVFG